MAAFAVSLNGRFSDVHRGFGGPCKPYLCDVHPSKFHFATLRERLARQFDIARYETIDYGISLCCVVVKASQR